MGKVFDKVEQGTLFDLPSVEELTERSLRDKFLVPPFSVFDAKQSYWQDRKRLWKSIGIKSELGRDAKTFTMNRKLTKINQNVLVFYKGDPKMIREEFKELDFDY